MVEARGPPLPLIHVDTSVLVDALTGARRSSESLRGAIVAGERLAISVVVLFEWLRGPRSDVELAFQEELLPADGAIPLTAAEAAIAAQLYRGAARARGREADITIAATALTHDASLWTLNPQDFRDIPGLRLYAPPR